MTEERKREERDQINDDLAKSARPATHSDAVPRYEIPFHVGPSGVVLVRARVYAAFPFRVSDGGDVDDVDIDAGVPYIPAYVKLSVSSNVVIRSPQLEKFLWLISDYVSIFNDLAAGEK
ncbi:hypothetical protein N7476_009363 [Penicillium atrosanguineum]|uniref:Uncharacterized protein n=1 Tax=Penicillium atrosanguineum TaxID=1132637 RepID=A0A9W9U0U4_9EURO|nr:hypothetical protein N7526_008487 [Penicillium atrosanguineum]KAJ5302564.1 hypothetical protein N7476_009363 [Penicillium atrosanguineum]